MRDDIQQRVNFCFNWCLSPFFFCSGQQQDARPLKNHRRLLPKRLREKILQRNKRNETQKEIIKLQVAKTNTSNMLQKNDAPEIGTRETVLDRHRSEKRTSFEDLPEEMLVMIFQMVINHHDVGSCCCVNRTWKRLLANEVQPLIADGSTYTLIVGYEGRCVAWGDNQFNQLGHSSKRFVDLSSADLLPFFGCRWGNNDPTRVKSIATGVQHCIAATVDGKCFTWGANTFGQLGISGFKRNSIIQMTSVPMQVNFLRGKHVCYVAAGDSHTAVVTAEGKCYTWGWNSFGQLGLGDSHITLCSKPHVVAGELQNQFVVFVTCGDQHTITINDNGICFSWGSNYYGQLGFFSDSQIIFGPRKMSCPDVFKQTSAGGFHTLGLTKEGTCYSWGRNEEGQLGLGDNKPRTFPEKINHLGQYLIKEISAGKNHSMAVTTDGKCYVWGCNMFGKLGGSFKGIHSKVPILIRSVESQNVVAICASACNTVLITNDQTCHSWGWKSFKVQLNFDATTKQQYGAYMYSIPTCKLESK